jgi:hypothetical protein
MATSLTHCIVRNEQLSVINLLVQSGADLDLTAQEYGAPYTAFSLAFEKYAPRRNDHTIISHTHTHTIHIIIERVKCV